MAGDNNVGGMVDFMAFMEFYLQSARMNHASTYAAIQAQPDTLAYMQFAWTRAEQILTAMYPYSTTGGGTQIVPLDVLQVIYSPNAIQELDRLGIAHKLGRGLRHHLLPLSGSDRQAEARIIDAGLGCRISAEVGSTN